jgi:hypothetical protein
MRTRKSKTRKTSMEMRMARRREQKTRIRRMRLEIRDERRKKRCVLVEGFGVHPTILHRASNTLNA